MSSKKFKVCEFPFCELNSFSCRINSHHIVPRSKKGTDHPSNRFQCCPNHHNAIYIPGETNGIHGKILIGNGENLSGSIILNRKVTSTAGVALIYSDCTTKKEYIYFYNLKENNEINLENYK
jgi:hypothetical protein